MIKMSEGRCRGCGQLQMVQAPESANNYEIERMATRKCSCAESKELIAWWDLVDDLKSVCSWESEKLGFKPIPAKAQEELKVICGSVNEGRIEKAQIVCEGSTISIVKKDGKVRITRKMTVEIDGESEAEA